MKKIIYTFLMLFIFTNCSSDSNETTEPIEDKNETVEIMDADNDGIADSTDNCVNNPNPDQADIDSDAIGDLCDPDRDGDNIINESDNCPDHPNPNQLDFNNNNVGDLCDNHTYQRLYHPESVVKYNDYYLVSNLGVQLLPDTADGDGFISLVNLDGTGLIQNYITGLDSPKGLEIINGLLYVCDLSELKVFNIETKEMVQSYSFQNKGVTLLNDVTNLFTDTETVFITATRTREIFKLNINSGAIEELVVEGVTLKQTNGIALDNENSVLYMVEFGDSTGSNARIVKIDLNDNSGSILGGGTTGFLYDGVVLVENTLYLTDWSHRLFSLDLSDPNSSPSLLKTGLSGPADIFYDSDLNKIVIPKMTAHSIDFYDL